MLNDLSSVIDVRVFQIQNVIDAGSRTLGFVIPVNNEPCPVAMAIDRNFVPLAVIKSKVVNGYQALAAAKVEPVSEIKVYVTILFSHSG